MKDTSRLLIQLVIFGWLVAAAADQCVVYSNTTLQTCDFLNNQPFSTAVVGDAWRLVILDALVYSSVGVLVGGPCYDWARAFECVRKLAPCLADGTRLLPCRSACQLYMAGCRPDVRFTLGEQFCSNNFPDQCECVADVKNDVRRNRCDATTSSAPSSNKPVSYSWLVLGAIVTTLPRLL